MPDKIRKYRVAILTISDRCSQGRRQDVSGGAIRKFIEAIPAEVMNYEIIPDDPKKIREKLIEYCDRLKVDLVLTDGGTGLGPRDFTPEATLAVIDKEVPGIAEAMRIECLKFTRNSMLSRAISGIRKNTLIINLPGSPRAVKESLETILGGMIHGLEMIAGGRHKNDPL